MSALGNAVVQFARDHTGQKVGERGECWDLAEQALAHAGAKTSRDFGPVGENTDYIWGTAINLNQLQPGDILQYRDYTIRVTEADGAWQEMTFTHHTAIVRQVLSNGSISVYEQNFNNIRRVTSQNLFIRPGTYGSRTVTVSGSIWAYRPQARS